MPVQLRAASSRQRPPRYREDDGRPIIAERPSFVHEDPVFDPELVHHCAFPSLDTNHPGRGPSEIWKARRDMEAAAAKNPAIVIDCDDGDNQNDEVSFSAPCSLRLGRSNRLILTVQDMSRLPRTVQQHETDKDGDTMMQSAGNGGVRTNGHRRAVSLLVSTTTRPKSPPASGQGRHHTTDSTRQAHTVSLRRRTLRQFTHDGEPTSSAGEAPSDGTFKITRRYPDWVELSDGVKYIIMHEMTKSGLSFTRAISQLGLFFEEAAQMIDLIGHEMAKAAKFDEYLKQSNDLLRTSWSASWLDEFRSIPPEPPVTETLGVKEIRQGKAFLNFMGLPEIAANLGYYMGSMGPDYDIPLTHLEEDGWQGLIPHFRVGCSEEVEDMHDAWEAHNKYHPRTMSDGELHVRMDAPPGTVNPRRLELTSSHEKEAQWLRKFLEGLHPYNYRIPDLEVSDEGDQDWESETNDCPPTYSRPCNGQRPQHGGWIQAVKQSWRNEGSPTSRTQPMELDTTPTIAGPARLGNGNGGQARHSVPRLYYPARNLAANPQETPRHLSASPAMTSPPPERVRSASLMKTISDITARYSHLFSSPGGGSVTVRVQGEEEEDNYLDSPRENKNKTKEAQLMEDGDSEYTENQGRSPKKKSSLSGRKEQRKEKEKKESPKKAARKKQAGDGSRVADNETPAGEGKKTVDVTSPSTTRSGRKLTKKDTYVVKTRDGACLEPADSDIPPSKKKAPLKSREASGSSTSTHPPPNPNALPHTSATSLTSVQDTAASAPRLLLPPSDNEGQFEHTALGSRVDAVFVPIHPYNVAQPTTDSSQPTYSRPTALMPNPSLANDGQSDKCGITRDLKRLSEKSPERSESEKRVKKPRARKKKELLPADTAAQNERAEPAGFSRLSTTPISVPVIPDFRSSSTAKIPASRPTTAPAPASDMASVNSSSPVPILQRAPPSSSRSSPQSSLSEADIIGMGGTRAELEILKNRKKAKATGYSPVGIGQASQSYIAPSNSSPIFGASLLSPPPTIPGMGGFKALELSPGMPFNGVTLRTNANQRAAMPTPQISRLVRAGSQLQVHSSPATAASPASSTTSPSVANQMTPRVSNGGGNRQHNLGPQRLMFSPPSFSPRRVPSMPPGTQLGGTSINDHGQILGVGTWPGGTQQVLSLGQQLQGPAFASGGGPNMLPLTQSGLPNNHNNSHNNLLNGTGGPGGHQHFAQQTGQQVQGLASALAPAPVSHLPVFMMPEDTVSPAAIPWGMEPGSIQATMHQRLNLGWGDQSQGQHSQNTQPQTALDSSLGNQMGNQTGNQTSNPMIMDMNVPIDPRILGMGPG